MKKSGLSVYFVIFLSIVLAACGGGGSNSPPVASAGPTQTVNEVTTVNLDGRDSSDLGGKITAYQWTQVSGDAVALVNANTATPTFTAPTVSNAEGSKQLVFKLKVTDDGGASDEATVKIIVSAVNGGLDAYAGTNQKVVEGAAVKLSGVGTDEDGDVVTYKWVQVSGTTVTLTGANTATPSFTAPTISANESNNLLEFRLTVTDGVGVIATDTVTVAVSMTNKPPVPNAGSDLEVNEGVVVRLSGSATDANRDTLTYSWVQTSGKYGVVLSGANTATPSFTAPLVTENTTLIFTLTVNDGNGATAMDAVSVAVKKIPNVAPVAKAGTDQIVNEKVAVTLSGSGSSDTDGTIASYTWTQTGGAAVTLSGANTANLSFTAPTITTAEGSRTLLFKLKVKDDQDDTDEDTVSVTVKAVNESPTANAGSAQQVLEGATVSLVGTGTDPDEDTLTYSWVQVGTPAVTLTGATAATASFTAPLVSADTTLTFTLTVKDSNGSTASQNTTVLVKDNPVIQPTPTGKLNDTGITLCGDYAYAHAAPNNHDNNVVCTLLTDDDNDPVPPINRLDGAGKPTGQDAHVGRDATANVASDGRAGFSFTKINSAGQALPADATAWSCVKDNVTGLIWEVKTDNATPDAHDKDVTYTWANADTYAQTVNTAGWCGVTAGWRLPTVNELQGITDLSRSNPAIDTPSYFPNTVSARYWSATPYSTTDSFGVDFAQGSVIFAPNTTTSYAVRLVRGP